MSFSFPTLNGYAELHNRMLPTKGFKLHLKWGVLSISRFGEPFHEIFLHSSTVTMQKGFLTVTCCLFNEIGLSFRKSTETKKWFAALKASSDWNIESYYIVGERIGAGAFGSVFESVCKDTREEVAIKQIHALQGTKELELMEILDHPNVISALDVLRTADYSYIVLPIMKKYDLDRILNLKKNRRMKEEEAKACFLQLLEGLKYLHSIDVIHCDLKPENIMCTVDPLTGKDVYKIIDFGGAVRLPKKGGSKDRAASTLGYASPEVLNSRAFNEAADIWSCGAILYEMLTGELAFSDTLFESKEVRSKRGKYNRFRFRWFRVAQKGKALVKKLLHVDERNRGTVVDALNHSFMQLRKSYYFN